MPERCARCRAPAVLVRPYSGEALCLRHLRDDIILRIKRAISRHSMLTPLDSILLDPGEDGAGPALLLLMHTIERRFPRVRLLLALDDTMPNAPILRDLAEDLGVETLPLPEGPRVPPRADLDPVELAMTARLIRLQRAAASAGCTKIALAMTATHVASRMLRMTLSGAPPLPPALSPSSPPPTPLVIPMISILHYELAPLLEDRGIKLEVFKPRDVVDLGLLEAERRHPGSIFSFIRLAEEMIARGVVRPKVCPSCGKLAPEAPCAECRALRP